jgi:hypothetical protein
MSAGVRRRLADWSIITVIGAVVWLLTIHVLMWAASTFGLVPAAGGLAAIALVGLGLALVGVWRDHRAAQQPWREPTWAEREALR